MPDLDSTSAFYGRDTCRRRETVAGRPTADQTEDPIMPTRITLIYDNPADPDAFESGYPDQLALARKLPGLQRIATAKVVPKEDGSPTPAYRLVDLYFADYDTAARAVTTEEAGALFPQVLSSATGGVRIVFADVEEE
jgi:uncharacterized protein (TIGR02118 family)